MAIGVATLVWTLGAGASLPLLAQTPTPPAAIPDAGSPAPSPVQAPSGSAVPAPGVVESAPLAPPPGASPSPTTPAPAASPLPPAAAEVPAAPSPVPGAPPAGAPSGTPPATTPPATAAPVQPVPSSPSAPAAPGVPPSLPSLAAPAPGAPNPRATLLPVPGDPSNVDDVTLVPKPAAIRTGMATWNEGFARLADAVRKLEEDLRKAGVPIAGRPLSRFLETDDLGFRYEVMVPIAQSAPTGLPADIRLGMTPSGRMLRFTHKASYDEIDGTYEAITAYLDAKGVTVNDSFVEEYVTDLTHASDPGLEINIFVSPR